MDIQNENEGAEVRHREVLLDHVVIVRRESCK